MICLAATENSLSSSPAHPSVTLTRTTRTRRPSLSSVREGPSQGTTYKTFFKSDIVEDLQHSFIPVCIFSDFLQRVPYICYHPFTRLEGKPCPMIVFCKRSVLTSADPGSPSMCSPTPSSRSPSSAPSSSTATSWWSQTRSKYTECDVSWLFGALNFY